MQIYFDDNLVPEDYYMSYSDNFSSFDDSFYLGSSASLNATLQVPIVAWPGIINNVRIEVDGSPVATLKVDNITVNDDNSITLDLVDILTHTSSPCDFSALITYQKTYDPETDTWTETGTGINARDLLNFICQSYSITQGEFELTNGDTMIYSYDNSMTGRNYLEMIAELQGGYVHIDETGVIYIKYYNRESRNLYRNSDTYSGNDSNGWILGGTIDTNETKDGSYSIRTATAWQGPGVNLVKLYEAGKIEIGDRLTYSVYFKTNFVPNNSPAFSFTLYRGSTGTSGRGIKTFSPDEIIPGQWYRVYVTFEITDYSITSDHARIELNYYDTNDRYYFGNNRTNYVWFSQPQVEKGSILTDYESSEKKTFRPLPDDLLSYNDVDTYKLSEEITIERVVYDDGVTEPKKSSEDDSLYTLYLSTDNLFLQNIVQAEFNKICNNIIGYKFYNIHIDNCNRFFTPGSTIWFERESGERIPIMVNYTRDYVGGFVGSYDTKISGAKRTETEVIPTEDKIKRIRTILNQMDNSLTIQASKSDNLKTKTSELRIDLNKVQSLFQITGGSNLIRNSQFLLPDETWTFTESAQDAYHTPIGSGYNSSLIGETVAVANIILRKSKARTEINNVKVNTTHNLNYYISQDYYTTTHVRLISKNAGNTIFDDVITTDSTHTITMRNYSHTIETTDSDYYFEIETTTTMSGYCKIYDLMFNSGDKKSWEPAASEVYSTILKMSQQGFQVYSSGSNILTLITSDGFQVREAQDGQDGEVILGRIVSQFNNEGIITEIVRMTKAVIGKYIQEELTLNNFIHHVEYFEE